MNRLILAVLIGALYSCNETPNERAISVCQCYSDVHYAFVSQQAEMQDSCDVLFKEALSAFDSDDEQAAFFKTYYDCQ